MSQKVFVAPSLLAADPLRFKEELENVEKCGADYHHVDVMDGHFVPNLTYGIPLVAAIKKNSSIPLDVHIMVSNPDEVALDYVKAGADILCFHIEAATHSHRLIQSIQAAGAKAGVAINPGTSISQIEAILPYVDMVNMMSVNPGFGGQKFIKETVDRIRMVRSMLEKLGRADEVLIEVDGGVNRDTADSIKAAGANMLVAGTFVYKAEDQKEAISFLKK